MITNDQLLKLFVRVPSTVENFNGVTVSGATNEHRLFFDEATGLIWAKGKSYGMTPGQATALSTLIGSDTNKSVRDIVNEIIGIGDDANEVIDRLKEVLDYFNNVSESETGVALIADVAAAKTAIGAPAVLYTAEEAATANAELTGAVAAGDAAPADFEEKVDSAAADSSSLTAEEAAAYNATLDGAVAEGDVKTAATGLYAYIDAKEAAAKSYTDDKIAAIDLSDYATKTHVEDRLGALGNATEAEGNTPAVPHTAKSYVDAKIGNLGNKVEAQAAVLYTAEDDEVIAGTKQVGDVKTPAVEAVPYTSVMEVVTDNELVTAAAINDLSDRVDALEEFNPWETYVAPAPVEP